MKYYIILLQNVETGEQEYSPQYTSENKIKDVAIKLVEQSNLDKEVIKIHIYKLEEVIYNGEY